MAKPTLDPSSSSGRPGGPVVTVFATMKPFQGQAAIHQRNAILSWTLLRPRPDVILFGDEDGVAEICQELGLRHAPDVDRTEGGTPLIPDLFGKARRLARTDTLCFANADIVFTDDLMQAIERLRAWRPRSEFLATGMRWNVWVEDPIDFSGDWSSELRRAGEREGVVGGHWALDYFVFPRDLSLEIPPLAVGRPTWDDWMVYGARARGIPVVDMTPSVAPVHQRHDYGHHPGGRAGVFLGPEARRNLELTAARLPEEAAAGFGLHDATHVLAGGRVRPAWRVHGAARTLRREIVRLPALHPKLRASVRFGRTLYRDLRRAALRGSAAPALAALTGRRLIHCFGDRSALIFGELRWRGSLVKTLFDETVVVDASGSALADGPAPGSPTRVFRRVIEALPRDRTLLFSVGERDCATAGQVDSARAADGMTTFLDTLLREGRRDLIVMAVPPPTERMGGEDSEDRVRRSTEATRTYNAVLRAWASNRGCRFLDYESDVFDPETGLVRERFRMLDQTALPLDAAPWSEVLASRLREMGFR